jgi:hypothetical protein
MRPIHFTRIVPESWHGSSESGPQGTLPHRTNHADLACCVTVTGNVKENVEP